MEDTYLGLSRSKVLTIHNRSDYVVKFQWMRFKDNDTDVQRKEEYVKIIISIVQNFYPFHIIFRGRYKNLFQLVHNVEIVRHVNLVHYNICLPDIHELVCQRIYTDEIASLTNENFRYNHMSFLLIPEVILYDNLTVLATFNSVIYLNYSLLINFICWSYHYLKCILEILF